MEEVYVLLVSNNVNGAGVEHDIMLFADSETANAELKALKNKFLKEIENEIDNWVFDDDSESEYLPSFEAYENGFYNQNYISLAIYQREIV